MGSSQQASAKSSPRRNTSKRTPLQERTQSQTNERSSRLVRDSKNSPGDANIFNTTPFPTKPAHVLLPSTIRKQRNGRGTENNVPDFWSSNPSGPAERDSSARRGSESQDGSRSGRTPTLTLKRSVATLRDMYESQAEQSRPSTAASPALRPTTSSSRIRSVSSSDASSGRYAWELLHKISSDDLALLPSLDEVTARKVQFHSPFATRAAEYATSSSPNYRIYEAASSPRLPVFKDHPSPILETTDLTPDSQNEKVEPSSPNVIRLGSSSSVEDVSMIEQSSSSPNVIKLGSSSPSDVTSNPSTVPRTPGSVESTPRKRKRGRDDSGPSLNTRAGAVNPFPSSPPYNPTSASSPIHGIFSPERQTTMGSSPKGRATIIPYAEESSPIVNVHRLTTHSVEDSSPTMNVHNLTTHSVEESSPDFRVHSLSSEANPFGNAHSNLQTILSSSPTPRIQYPIVRAPVVGQLATLSIPKRQSRTTPSNPSDPRSSSHLSSAQPDWSFSQSNPSSKSTSKDTSKRSSFREEFDDFKDSESLAPAQAYIISNDSANNSQVRMISEADHHEATDAVSALPTCEWPYRSPPMRPIRSVSYHGPSSASSSQSRLNSMRNSMDTRLNSLKSFALSQHDSAHSSTHRPGSSGSVATNVVVPTWARRYYSGFYRDSFQYMYASPSKAGSTLSLAPPPRPETAGSRNSGNSFASLRKSCVEIVAPIVRPRNRPRLEARKSHLTVGVGPLVSNPVRPQSAVLSIHSRTISFTSTINRRVSAPLAPVDPRAHWNGIAEEKLDDVEGSPQDFRQHRISSGTNPSQYDPSFEYLPCNRISRLAGYSPHLHHDHRLNTGSTASRGYGFPFNQKPRWHAPSMSRGNEVQSFGGRRRNVQIMCFLIGFVLPFMWFIGAFLPLPSRPEAFNDVEKSEWDRSSAQLGEWEEMDVIAKLRLERHLRGVEEVEWQNTRWWRNLNRWMSIVGAVVLILVIVLAVLGATQNW